MARKLFTVDEVKPFLDLAGGPQDTTQDELLKILIEGATAWIEKYCAQTFESGGISYSETYDGDNGTVLYLNHRPVISVSSVVITDSADVDDTIPSTDYELYETVGKIVLTEGDSFLKGDLNVAISYVAGESTLPADVKLAGMKLVRWHYRKWNDDRDGISSVSVGDITTNYESGVPAEITQALAPHRNVMFG